MVFNSMMDEVEESFNSQKQFVNDASHELRTPLTIINGHLKMLDRWGKNDKETLDKSIKISLNEVERLTKLVNDLLQLSKVENELVINDNLKEVNIYNVVSEVIYDFEMINKNVKFTYNIKNNNNNINISVKDNGIGIPKEDIPKITDKFYRVDKSRKYNNSFGIGLSIAMQIIKLYKGTFHIDSTVGDGTKVSVILHENKK